MSGSALRNFRFFEQLCGEAITNSAIVTNMWNLADPAIAKAREEELEEGEASDESSELSEPPDD